MVGFSLAADDPPEDKTKDTMNKLQGSWKVDSAEADGKPFDKLKEAKFVFDRNTFTVTVNGMDEKNTYKVQPDAKPPAFTFEHARGEKPINGIYQLEGETFKLCIRTKPELPAPTEFKTKADSAALLLVLKKVKR
jgi:uncharacterized protein (TIGR03067 family)